MGMMGFIILKMSAAATFTISRRAEVSKQTALPAIRVLAIVVGAATFILLPQSGDCCVMAGKM
jgi:hypothetical protein